MSALREVLRAGGAKLPNRSAARDLKQKPEYDEHPKSNILPESSGTLKLNTTIEIVSVADILNAYGSFDAEFSKASQNKTDALTGLNTGAGVLDQIKKNQKYIDFNGNGDDTMVMARIDIERFKTMNDLHGHTAGDEMLQDLALRMQECFSHSTILGRVGGDEFVVFFYQNGITIDRANDAIHKALAGKKSVMFMSEGKLDSMDVEVATIMARSAQIYKFPDPAAPDKTTLGLAA